MKKILSLIFVTLINFSISKGMLHIKNEDLAQFKNNEIKEMQNILDLLNPTSDSSKETKQQIKLFVENYIAHLKTPHYLTFENKNTFKSKQKKFNEIIEQAQKDTPYITELLQKRLESFKSVFNKTKTTNNNKTVSSKENVKTNMGGYDQMLDMFPIENLEEEKDHHR